MTSKADRKVNIHTRISSQIRDRWNTYLLEKHGTIRGSFSYEIENAILQYMNSGGFDGVKIKKPYNSVVRTLRALSSGLKDLPSYPMVNHMIARCIVNDYSGYSDKRTLNKYLKLITKYSQETVPEGEIFPALDVTEFCKYADRKVMEAVTTDE